MIDLTFKNILSALLILLVFYSCKKNDEDFETYTGYWSGTLWKLKVYADDSLFIVPQGHFSNEVSGKIKVKRNKDTLLLDGEIISSLPNFEKLVFIDDNSCLVDLNSKFYCKNDSWQKKQRNENIYLEKLEQRLIKLDLIKNIFDHADSLNQSVLFFPISVVYEDGIKKYIFTVTHDISYRFMTIEKVKFDPSQDKFYKLDSMKENWVKMK